MWHDFYHQILRVPAQKNIPPNFWNKSSNLDLILSESNVHALRGVLDPKFHVPNSNLNITL
jgi:hypothetical protein